MAVGETQRNLPEDPEIFPQIDYTVLEDEDALLTHLITSDRIWERALRLSVDVDHPVYDTLFVAAAQLAGEKLISHDESLKTKFPDLALSLKPFLAL